MVLELLTTGTPSEDAVLGLWREQSAAPGFALAADLENVPVWRAALPNDRASADAVFDAADRQAASLPLPDLIARIDAAVDTPATPAERELVAGLRPVQVTVPPFAAGNEAVSADQAMADAGELVERVARWCGTRWWVETRVGGRLCGRSLVMLDGSVTTVIGRSDDVVSMRAHWRSLRLVAATRAALLRTTAVVLRGATHIAARLALPGGPVLALPAVWRFVQQLRAAAADRGC